jgi:AcrR family transcriptional regulator
MKCLLSLPCLSMKNKELTKRKLIDAIGEISKSQGLKGLKISKVSRHAGVDRKLIYRYFGNLNNLIEAYIIENDYWMLFADHLKKTLREGDRTGSQAFITTVLQEQFRFFLEKKEMQLLILMELSEKNPLMQSIHNARESLGQDFFEITDEHFASTTVNFRAVAALLVGGIYYIILHTRHNGYKFSDIDLRSEEGINAILETIANVIDWSFLSAVK